MLRFIVRKQQGRNKRQGFSARFQGLARLPPSIHHHAPRKVPGAIALAFRNQGISISLEFGFKPRSTPPTKQSHGAFSTSSSLKHACTVSKPWKVEIIDVVSRDDVGVGRQHRGRQAFKDILFFTAVLEDLPFSGSQVFDTGGRTEHCFVFNARFEVKRKHGVRHGKRFGRLNIPKRTANGEIDAITSSTSCIKHLGLEDRAVGFPRVHHLS